MLGNLTEMSTLEIGVKRTFRHAGLRHATQPTPVE
jgi:hypothetical protein